MTEAFLGIDAGGSQTRAAVGTAAGIAGSGLAGPANWTALGAERCVQAVVRASEQALVQAGRRVDEVVRACIGLAGYYPPWHEREARSALALAFPGLSIRLVPDLLTAWAGATGRSAGIVLVTGTGAVAYGRDAHGRAARAGGWGPLFGDEGSGYWIGGQVLRAVSRSLDGRGASTSLTEAVEHPSIDPDPDSLEAFPGSDRPSGSGEEALRSVYRDAWTREQVAALSLAAARQANAGDKVARQILAEAAAELGGLVEAVARRLGGHAQPLPIYAVGGVMEAGPALRAPLERWIAAVLPSAEWKPPLGSPLAGALLLAQEEDAGWAP